MAGVDNNTDNASTAPATGTDNGSSKGTGTEETRDDGTTEDVPRPAPELPLFDSPKENPSAPEPTMDQKAPDPATAAALERRKDSREGTHLGYGPDFPERLLERLQLKLQVPAGGPKPRFVLTKSVVVADIPEGSAVLGVLEPGDWIRAVDGKRTDRRRRVYSLLKQRIQSEAYSVTFSIKRPLRTVALTSDKQLFEYVPPALEIVPGYTYLLGFLAVYAGARVGLRVKSFESRVYVCAIAHGSVAELTFQVGDVIISVDDFPVATVAETQSRLQEALRCKPWVQTVVERPEARIALQRNMLVLRMRSRFEPDPKMPVDIVGITERELIRMREAESQPPPPLPSILRGRNSRRPRSLSVCPTSMETPIQCDPVNLKMLSKVPCPGRFSFNERLMTRRRAPQGRPRVLQSPSGITYHEWSPSSSGSSLRPFPPISPKDFSGSNENVFEK